MGFATIAQCASSSLWSRFVVLAWPHRRILLTALLLSSLSVAASLVLPLGVRMLIDGVTRAHQPAAVDRVALMLFALAMVPAICTFTGSYVIRLCGDRVVAVLRGEVYRHLHANDLAFLGRWHVADLISRLATDAAAIRTATTDALVRAVLNSLKLLGAVMLLMFLNWRFGIFIVLTLCGAGAITRWFAPRLRRASRHTQQKLADLSTIAEEALRNTRVVRIFGREQHELQRFQTAIDGMLVAGRHAALFGSGFSGLLELLFATVLVAVFWWGGHELLAGRLTAGGLVASVLYAQTIAHCVGELSIVQSAMSTAAGASDRIFDILDSGIRARPEQERLPQMRQPLRGHLVFDRVSFSYGDRPGVHAITFDIRPGQKLALIGPSGSGKTTLLNLIARLYEPNAGRILLDGQDSRTLRAADVRANVAMVPQEIELFSATVRDNIRYGSPLASDEQVQAAARAANAHDFIVRLADGYDTHVGQRGTSLSGGQRQRIALARALTRHAPLLLLDEPMGAIDSESEELVWRAIGRLPRPPTIIVSAHRLETVEDADLILVLDEGEIVARGTHEELSRRDGFYARVAARQRRAPAQLTVHVPS